MKIKLKNKKYLINHKHNKIAKNHNNLPKVNWISNKIKKIKIQYKNKKYIKLMKIIKIYNNLNKNWIHT